MGAKRSRDERKDRAAEQRRIQRARDRRQRRIVYGIAAPVALLIIAAVPATNWYHAHQRGQQHAVGYVRAASTAAKAAGCTGVRNDRQIPTSIVKAGTTVDYAALTAKAGSALPPTSGPREADVLADTPAFFALTSAPHPERAVGNLNHGYIVVWYDSKLSAKDVNALKAAPGDNTRTLVVPWTRSVFPDGQHVVFTAWDRTQRCTSASANALSEFATKYRDDASGKNWASPSAPTPGGAAGPAPAASASASAKPSGSAKPAAPTSPAPASGTGAPLAPLPLTSSTFPTVTVTPAR